MIVGTANVHLYTAFDATALDAIDCYEALTAAEVSFTHLHYTDPAQRQQVLAAVSTWHNPYLPEEQQQPRPPVTAFPFVTYDERHDDYTSVRRVVEGKDAILALIEAGTI